MVKSTTLLFLVALPFFYLVGHDPQNFLGRGYIGGHFLRENQTLTEATPTFFENLKKGLLMLHRPGDANSRSNPPGLPQLDPVSGVFLFLGIGAFWPPFAKASGSRRGVKLLGHLAVAYFILLLPSVLVLAQPQEVPSASRAITVVPIAYLLVGNGIYWFYQRLKLFKWPGLAQVGLAFVLLLVLLLNYQRYFVDYIQSLPNQ